MTALLFFSSKRWKAARKKTQNCYSSCVLHLTNKHSPKQGTPLLKQPSQNSSVVISLLFLKYPKTMKEKEAAILNSVCQLCITRPKLFKRQQKKYGLKPPDLAMLPYPLRQKAGILLIVWSSQAPATNFYNLLAGDFNGNLRQGMKSKPGIGYSHTVIHGLNKKTSAWIKKVILTWAKDTSLLWKDTTSVNYHFLH